jgi:hypothetical protein
MRALFLLFLGSGILFAEDAADFFKASAENKLLCRSGYESYMIISQKNASPVNINGNTFFKYTSKNLYIPKNSCTPISRHKEPITY